MNFHSVWRTSQYSTDLLERKQNQFAADPYLFRIRYGLDNIGQLIMAFSIFSSCFSARAVVVIVFIAARHMV